MTKLGGTLRTLIDVFPPDRPFALVGGLAVSARTEPRFTRDLDFAISVDNDADAESLVFSLQERGFKVVATIEHMTTHRLATARLRQDDRAPFVDLLFASCGVEREIVGSASVLEVLGATVRVAAVGHLIAMKLLSRDAKRRPRDQQDLVDLAKVADALEWERAEEAVELIRQRGFPVDAIFVPGSPRSEPWPTTEPDNMVGRPKIPTGDPERRRGDERPDHREVAEARAARSRYAVE